MQSRYYDPAIGRFINGDGLASTGQGILGCNMFAYCRNEPVGCSDPGGLLCCTVVMEDGSGKQSSPYYYTADQAAAAFARNTYSLSSYVKLEFATAIYSINIDGVTYYNYVTPQSGNPHDCIIPLNSVPENGNLVGYAHTHPNSNTFSKADLCIADNQGITAYVIGPNLILQRYDPESSSTVSLHFISPEMHGDVGAIEMMVFQIKWNLHLVDGKCPKNYGCENMAWPSE